MSTSPFPPGYVRFDDVRTLMTEQRRVQVSKSVALETIHGHGSDPAVVFVHGSLDSLWNPYPQLDAFEGEQELVDQPSRTRSVPHKAC